MKVSVVIPTYNEEKSIEECLASLIKQTYKDLEIIVVDDGSTDNTGDILGKWKMENGKWKMLRQKHKGPGAARNLGAKHANGEILVFVDADMTFEPDLVEKLVAPILEGKAGGTFSKEEYISNYDNVWSQCWGINEGWEKGKRHSKDYPDTQKVFRAILKREFEKVGGFSADTGYTDDWTLSEKLGYEAVVAPSAEFYHKNPETLSEVFNQARWIGKRRYKLGKFGALIALVRSSLPFSLTVGLFKSLVFLKPQFLLFKVIYDLGIFLGIFDTLITGNTAR